MTTYASGSSSSTAGALVTAGTARGKQWRQASGATAQLTPEFLAACLGSEIIARILWSRDVRSAKDAENFLDPAKYEATPASQLPDMEKAVARINLAIQKKEHITIYGDYDVDGVTATSVLLTVLQKLGASVDFYIPNRAGEGYGLNLKAISVIASKHRTKLIITCDCGVSNFAEINFAKSLGVDSLVLDHHTMPEMLPPAVAIVHPKRLDENHPFFHLPGVGVAYKVAEALLSAANMPNEADKLLDFVTLGMIADLVPLVRECRYLVQIGLPKLIQSERPGLIALLAQVRQSEGTDLVGFGLAPRINAVGRLSDARSAVELMTATDVNVAEELARKLQAENTRRQELCEKIFFEADLMVTQKINLDSDFAIAIYKEGWHHGVVGIVASRLVEKYHRPVFIGELDKAENVVKGSARSVSDVDLYAVLKENEHLLTKWGGHKMAAGFSVPADKAEVLCRGLTNTCNRLLAGKSMKPKLEIDCEVEAALLDLDLPKLLASVAPFGMGNKKPLLLTRKLVVDSSRVLGKEGKHHRIIVLEREANELYECVMWNSQGKVPNDAQEIDIVYTPEVNLYNSKERLQLVLSDWRISKEGAIGSDVSAGEDAEETVESAQSAEETHENNAPSRSPIQEQKLAQEHVQSWKIKAPSNETVEGDEDLAAQLAGMELDTLEDKTSRAKIVPPAKSTGIVKVSIKDLRQREQAFEVAQKAKAKLGDAISIFAESGLRIAGLEVQDRQSISENEHLLFLHFPPSLKLTQDVVARSKAQNIYWLGAPHAVHDEPGAFLKQLMGLAKYAVNQKDGEVEGEKLCSLLGATKMSVALGLTLLQKLQVIDWFAEDGRICLELTGAPQGNPEEFPEFKQLVHSLDAAKQYREWCWSAPLKEIQLAVMPNHIGLNAASEQRTSNNPKEELRDDDDD